MAQQRKPAVVLERAGRFAHDPQRRRADLKGKGELPATPPAWLKLNAAQVEIYHRLRDLIPDGVATGSDLITVAMLARWVAKIQSGKGKSSDIAQIRALANSLGMSASARAALGAGGGGRKANPFEEF